MFLNFATYIALEHDTRGFVGEKGWAHAFMHIGNLLDELAHDETLPRADKIFLLTILIEKLKRLDTPLIMGENRRLIGFITELVKTNELYSQYFLKQLKQWRQEATRQMQPDSESDWHRLYNQQRFLQALLMRDNLPQEITDYLNESRNFWHKVPENRIYVLYLGFYTNQFDRQGRLTIMSEKLNIAMLFGGNSSEHDVSKRSAHNIYDAMDKEEV